jgi:hypothetical protein
MNRPAENRPAKIRPAMNRPSPSNMRLPRGVLVGLTCALTTAGVTAATLLAARRLGLDRPGPVGVATGVGLFAVAGMLSLVGRWVTRRSRTGTRGGGRE